MSSLLMVTAQGDDRLVGLPIFTTRRFFHTGISCGATPSIDTPADLKGKRVGVPEYQQTAALWTRGVLQHEFGVQPEGHGVWMERTAGAQPRRRDRLQAAARASPSTSIPADKSIGTMMLVGRARRHDPLHRRSAIWSTAARSICTAIPTSSRSSRIRRRKASATIRRPASIPINHGMVVKRELSEQHPWAVPNLFKAFNRANELVDAERTEHVEYYLEAGLVPAEAGRRCRRRSSHGVKANRLRARDHGALFERAGAHPARDGTRRAVRRQHDGAIGVGRARRLFRAVTRRRREGGGLR